MATAKLFMTVPLMILSVGLPWLSAQNIENRMTAAEFQAAGHNKLSGAELVRLNDWLTRNYGRSQPATETSMTFSDLVFAPNPDGWFGCRGEMLLNEKGLEFLPREKCSDQMSTHGHEFLHCSSSILKHGSSTSQ